MAKRSPSSGKFLPIPVESLKRAPWNYKQENKALTKKLVANIKRNGQLENLVVRELDGEYEVVNGNHRLDAYKELGVVEAMCLNLGDVPVEAAMRVAIELNETRFPTNDRKLALLVAAILKQVDKTDALSTLPFQDVELDAMLKGLDPDWDAFTMTEAELRTGDPPEKIAAPKDMIEKFKEEVRLASTNQENLATLDAIPVEHFRIKGSTLGRLMRKLQDVQDKEGIASRDLAFQVLLERLFTNGG
jgi:ParB-like chromosome segregation protein Spo0J